MLFLFTIWAIFWLSSVVQDVLIFTKIQSEKIWMLDVDVERGFYTWLSTVLLAIAGLIAATLSSGSHGRLQWRLIAAILFLMSIDEMVGLHEKLSAHLEGGSGPFFFAWVVPASIAGAVVALLLLPFVLRLPRRVGVLIILSGAIFVMGAIGFEMMSGDYLSAQQDQDLALATPIYRFFANAEEGLEGIGVLLLMLALLRRASQVFPTTFPDDPAR